MFDALTYQELAALSAKFRSARQASRKVMLAKWWDVSVTDTYRRMVMDFQNDDPLFTEERRAIELPAHMAE